MASLGLLASCMSSDNSNETNLPHPQTAAAARIGFGKHKGKQLGSLPEAYLRWMAATLGQQEGGLNWVKLAAEVLNDRRMQHGSPSLELEQLENALVGANPSTYASMLRQFGSPEALVYGKLVHSQMLQHGHEQDTFLGNLLVQMYGKCKSLDDARAVFNRIQPKNVFSWTIMIAACDHNGNEREAVELFWQMGEQGVEPNAITFINVLGACSKLGVLAEGKLIHGQITAFGLESHVVLSTALVSMYGKCGSLQDARRVFDKMQHRNVVSWNAIIEAYSREGHGREAIKLCQEMDLAGVKPDTATFTSVLGACSTLGDLQEVHARISLVGLDSVTSVGNCLVSMYGKCGNHGDARSVFDRMQKRSVVSWNAIIGAYAQNGHTDGDSREALRLYKQMQEVCVKPNSITFSSVLSACSSLRDLAVGKDIHAHIVAAGLDLDEAVAAALVRMYCECGNDDATCRMAEQICSTSVVAWTCMIAAYAQRGHTKQALVLYKKMDLEGIKADDATFINVLLACSCSGALEDGKAVHRRIQARGTELGVVMGTALINMYGKCGSLDEARETFDGICRKNVASWTAMIAAYAQNGHAKEAVELFERIDVEPNGLTFTSILHACSHAGLLDEGWHYFILMIDHHGISPTLEHYGCMIDLLGRVGELGEAHELISTMPLKPDAASWKAFLSACRIHAAASAAEMQYLFLALPP